MILIDANVVSELMRPDAGHAVLGWFGQQDATAPHLSAIGEAELRRGAAMLPAGQRRDRLIAKIDAMVRDDFAGRVLSFDSAAAVAFAAIFGDRRAAGRPIGLPDCQIDATTRAHGAAMATCKVGDFEGCGIVVIDPWLDEAGA